MSEDFQNIVNNLNEKFVYSDNRGNSTIINEYGGEAQFVYTTTGCNDYILFGNICFYDSDNTDLSYNYETNEYDETIEEYVMANFIKFLDTIVSNIFRED